MASTENKPESESHLNLQQVHAVDTAATVTSNDNIDTPVTHDQKIEQHNKEEQPKAESIPPETKKEHEIAPPSAGVEEKTEKHNPEAENSAGLGVAGAKPEDGQEVENAEKSVDLENPETKVDQPSEPAQVEKVDQAPPVSDFPLESDSKTTEIFTPEETSLGETVEKQEEAVKDVIEEKPACEINEEESKKNPEIIADIKPEESKNQAAAADAEEKKAVDEGVKAESEGHVAAEATELVEDDTKEIQSTEQNIELTQEADTKDLNQNQEGKSVPETAEQNETSPVESNLSNQTISQEAAKQEDSESKKLKIPEGVPNTESPEEKPKMIEESLIKTQEESRDGKEATGETEAKTLEAIEPGISPDKLGELIKSQGVDVARDLDAVKKKVEDAKERALASTDTTKQTQLESRKGADEELETIKEAIEEKKSESEKADTNLPAQETATIPTQKSSSNILSKMKHSIAKVRKAITGKSPSSKTVSSEVKADEKLK